MPSLSYPSLVRASSEESSLALQAHHHLILGAASDVLSDTKPRIANNVETWLTSRLVITLSGTLNDAKVSKEDLLCSSAARHLVCFLETNIICLGLDHVSDVYIDEVDGRPKVNLTSSRCLPCRPRFPHAILVSLDLCYQWTTMAQSLVAGSDHILHPFVPKLSPSVEAVLHSAVEKFVSLHLIRRYPLIFGPWSKKLNSEAVFFPLIARSMFAVIAKSEDSSFQKKCISIMKAITKQYSPDPAGAQAISSNHIHQVDHAYMKAKSPQVTREAAFSLAMERLYRFCVRRVNIRASVTRHSASSDGLDDDLELHYEKSAFLQPRKPLGSFGNSISEELWLQDDEDERNEQRWSDTLRACPDSQPVAVTDDDFAVVTSSPSSDGLEVTDPGAPDTDVFHTRNCNTLLGNISNAELLDPYALTRATTLPLPFSPDIHLEEVGCHHLAEPAPKVALSPMGLCLLETDSDASSDSPTDSSMDLTDADLAVDTIWKSKVTLPDRPSQHPATGEECRLKASLMSPYDPVNGPTVAAVDRVWSGDSAWGAENDFLEFEDDDVVI